MVLYRVACSLVPMRETQRVLGRGMIGRGMVRHGGLGPAIPLPIIPLPDTSVEKPLHDSARTTRTVLAWSLQSAARVQRLQLSGVVK